MYICPASIFFQLIDWEVTNKFMDIDICLHTDVDIGTHFWVWKICHVTKTEVKQKKRWGEVIWNKITRIKAEKNGLPDVKDENKKDMCAP